MSRVYLITGASSDVGISLLRRIAKEQEEKAVFICQYYSDASRLLELGREYSNIDMITVRADLSVGSDVLSVLEKVREYTDAPDYMIHLPAVRFRYMRIKELDMDVLHKNMEVQAYSFMKILGPFLPLMKKKQSRIVVMLSSYVVDDMPPQFMIDYIVPKYALLGAMKAVAAEYGGKLLMCNAVSPVMMDTKFLSEIDPRIKEMSAAAAGGSLLSPEAVAPVIMEMLSDSCSVNGTNRLIEQ